MFLCFYIYIYTHFFLTIFRVRNNMEIEQRRRKKNRLFKNVSNVDERHERYSRSFEDKGYIFTRDARFRGVRCERYYDKHHFEICRYTGKYKNEILLICYLLCIIIVQQIHRI